MEGREKNRPMLHFVRLLEDLAQSLEERLRHFGRVALVDGVRVAAAARRVARAAELAHDFRELLLNVQKGGVGRRIGREGDGLGLGSGRGRSAFFLRIFRRFLLFGLLQRVLRLGLLVEVRVEVGDAAADLVDRFEEVADELRPVRARRQMLEDLSARLVRVGEGVAQE